MKVVIKIGGAALDDKELVRRCARAIADFSSGGHEVAVVHGGGKALTRTLAQLGKHTEFIQGLRVTDAETRDVALMVLAGGVNKALVAELSAIGQPAIGICGGDGFSFRARRKVVAEADLGYVGEICSVDTRWIEALWKGGAIPVISSIALGSDRQYYNINADQMASACAIGLHANALIFVTDVAGVKDASGEVIRWLPLEQIPRLVKESVVGGGMLPKLRACEDALQRGVNRVRILPASAVNTLPEFYMTKIESGTEVLVA